ncbi:MAG: hypothetical protein ABIE14_02285 [Patescibacteria group bacterium]
MPTASIANDNVLPIDVANYPNEWVAYFKGDEFVLDHDADPAKLVKRVKVKEKALGKEAILAFSTPKGSCFY